jgi:class 3 adenylate cyclase
MSAFCRLCPEQLLRPGDNADIGWIAIMFTDLKGSTELYDALGDATAYRLVRDHFDFLSDQVLRNHGFVVKTVGDAVMAAFSRGSRRACDPRRYVRLQFHRRWKQGCDAYRVEAGNSRWTVHRRNDR